MGHMDYYFSNLSYFSSIHEFFDSLLWRKEKTHEHNIHYSAFFDISMVTRKDFLAGFWKKHRNPPSFKSVYKKKIFLSQSTSLIKKYVPASHSSDEYTIPNWILRSRKTNSPLRKKVSLITNCTVSRLFNPKLQPRNFQPKILWLKCPDLKS